MKRMLLKTLANLSFISFCLLLQNCSPKSFNASSDNGVSTKGAAANLDGTPGGPSTPSAGPGFGNLTPAEALKYCPHMGQNKAASVNIDTFNLSGFGIVFLPSVNILNIQFFAGVVRAKANSITEISDFAGLGLLEAQKVGDINRYAGVAACLSTGQVGNINKFAGVLNIFGPKDSSGDAGNITEAAGLMYLSNMNWKTLDKIAGALEIKGGSIQLLSNISGRIVLDGVQVDKIDGLDIKGVIILENGATIKTTTNITGALIVH